MGRDVKRRLSVLVFCIAIVGSRAVAADPPRWAGEGQYRLIVEVAPVDLEARNQDELPADVEIVFSKWLDQSSESRRANLASLQVMRIDPKTGEPVKYDNYLYARGPFDRPFRWYDAVFPYEFPEVFRPSSYSGGERIRQISPRAGFMYQSIGDWRRGRLAFTHTQNGDAASTYAVYFDLLPAGAEPEEAPPRAWLGDGLPRCDLQGDSTTGSDATKISLDDFNGDGLVDIVYGEQYGQLFVMPNTGTRERPQFPYSKMLFEADGQPMDVGIHATALVVDWNQDGANDILAGTYQNSIAYFKNTGDNRHRKYEYQGFVKTADGNTLELPITPVAEKPAGVFKHDYYPVMASVDWNHDGRQDLLAGGYVTGRIYYYENVAQQPSEPPQLELRGPLEADGAPINVRDWGAAPCVADFNGDDLPDLISGSFTWLPHKKQLPSFLRYYENIGTPDKPMLTEKPFPYRGALRSFRLPVPRATDWNGDGLLDLMVASGGDIFLFENVGTANEPMFDIDSRAIPAQWGNARLPGRQFVDYNDDGLMDIVSGYTVHLNSGVGNPYRFDKTINVLPTGVHIDHPVELGDGHFWPYLADFDADGRIDVLFGDWHGQVWVHRHLSTRDENKVHVAGQRLHTDDKHPIKVGPQQGDTENDFTALQGARTVFTVADYDADGRNDLVIGDTYGLIRYYRNLGPAESPVFAAPVQVGDMGIRLLVDTVDWNDDGRPDVIAGSAAHKVSVFLNTGRQEDGLFSEGIPLQLPPIKETRVRAVDLNRDGDEDLFVMSTQGSVLVERSFLKHGYARGRVVAFEIKSAD